MSHQSFHLKSVLCKLSVSLSVILSVFVLLGGMFSPAYAQGHYIITTVAGSGSTWEFSGDGGPATAAQLNVPSYIAVDSNGNLYIVDTNNYRIRKVNTAGIISTVAGNGTFGSSGDGGPATAAQFFNPRGIAVDSIGNLYISDFGRIRKVDTAGIISTFVADTDALPEGALAVDSIGNLYLADDINSRIQKVNTSGTVSTFVNGVEPGDVTVDSIGNIYIADYGNNRIQKKDTAGIITTVAGNGVAGFSGDGGPAIAAQLNRPWSIAVDNSGNLYIADGWNNRIRKVDTAGIISTIAGNGSAGFSGDGGLATDAQIGPGLIAVDSIGNLYISDLDNNRIRKLTYAEEPPAFCLKWGSQGSGDGEFSYPAHIAIDKQGYVYVADLNNSRVQKFDQHGNFITKWGSYGGGNDQFILIITPFGEGTDSLPVMQISEGFAASCHGSRTR